MEEQSFSPIGRRVLVMPYPRKETSESGLIIPGMAAEKPTRGIVHAKGSQVFEVSVNDVILYERNAGMKTVVNGKEMLVMDENRILGIIRD